MSKNTSWHRSLYRKSTHKVALIAWRACSHVSSPRFSNNCIAALDTPNSRCSVSSIAQTINNQTLISVGTCVIPISINDFPNARLMHSCRSLSPRHWKKMDRATVTSPRRKASAAGEAYPRASRRYNAETNILLNVFGVNLYRVWDARLLSRANSQRSLKTLTRRQSRALIHAVTGLVGLRSSVFSRYPSQRIEVRSKRAGSMPNRIARQRSTLCRNQ